MIKYRHDRFRNLSASNESELSLFLRVLRDYEFNLLGWDTEDGESSATVYIKTERDLKRIVKVVNAFNDMIKLQIKRKRK